MRQQSLPYKYCNFANNNPVGPSRTGCNCEFEANYFMGWLSLLVEQIMFSAFKICFVVSLRYNQSKKGLLRVNEVPVKGWLGKRKGQKI